MSSKVLLGSEVGGGVSFDFSPRSETLVDSSLAKSFAALDPAAGGLLTDLDMSSFKASLSALTFCKGLITESFERSFLLFIICLGSLGGDLMLVGSLTGMILLLAVIFTSLEPRLGLGFIRSCAESWTGVMTSLGGGVGSLGGRTVTFTSIGGGSAEGGFPTSAVVPCGSGPEDCLSRSTSSGFAGSVTRNPALADTQSRSLQERS